jgi:hypothetical protein
MMAQEFGIPPSAVCNWHRKSVLGEKWRPDNYAIHGLHLRITPDERHTQATW